MSLATRKPWPVAALALLLAAPALAEPALVDPDAGLLELVTPPETAASLPLVDGLAFDPFGNLVAALEVPGALGGLVRIDVDTGAVERIVSGISRADQVALEAAARAPLHAASFLVTSEVTPASATQRLFRVGVSYDADGRVLRSPAPVALAIATSIPIGNPEGLVVLDSDGDYGRAGSAFVAEDAISGRILRVDPAGGASAVVASGLLRPEGLAFGDFAAAAEPALFAAETLLHRVIRVDAAGPVSTVGNPAEVALTFPDNVEFGPDGFLYVSEDRPAPQSRIVRIAADGAHEVFATGFGQASGLAFQPGTGDLYVSEQDFARIWRVRFAREARIDVRPRSPRNPIRPGSPGAVAVAIFGAPDLDASEIDAASLALGPAGAPLAHGRARSVDLDRDGLADLLAHFRVDASGIASGDDEVCVRGALLDGRPFRGCDAIETVPAQAPPRAQGVGPGRGR